MNKKQAKVFHEVRSENRVFLCITTPNVDCKKINSMREAGRSAYAVEREVLGDATPESIRSLIADMAAESGLELIPSHILKEMGV